MGITKLTVRTASQCRQPASADIPNVHRAAEPRPTYTETQPADAEEQDQEEKNTTLNQTEKEIELNRMAPRQEVAL